MNTPPPIFDKNCEAYWELSDYVPVDDLVKYWCNDDSRCQEAKKHALIGALDREEVHYRRRDGKTFKDPAHELYAQGLILVSRESFLTWAESISEKVEKRNLQDNMPIGARSETTYLNIIGAMVDLMLNQSPGGQAYSVFHSQSEIIEKLVLHHENLQGLSRRTLETKFAAAKDQMS